MKLIIAGSRTFKSLAPYVEAAILHFGIIGIKQIISGSADGIDEAGEEWAELNGFHTCYFVPNWGDHGKAAGPIRNRLMAKYADELLLIWDGLSIGSLSMKTEMLKVGKPIYEMILKSEGVKRP